VKIPDNPSESFKRRNPGLFLMQGHAQTMANSVPNAEMVDDKPCEAEREMHDQFERWLRVHEKGPIPYVHSAMNRKSTVREGLPDFVVMFQERCCLVEFKMPGNKPTDIQMEVITEFSRAGVSTRVCWSVTEAIEFTREKLGL